jgi:hypothetical protein
VRSRGPASRLGFDLFDYAHARTISSEIPPRLKAERLLLVIHHEPHCSLSLLAPRGVEVVLAEVEEGSVLLPYCTCRCPWLCAVRFHAVCGPPRRVAWIFRHSLSDCRHDIRSYSPIALQGARTCARSNFRRLVYSGRKKIRSQKLDSSFVHPGTGRLNSYPRHERKCTYRSESSFCVATANAVFPYRCEAMAS